MYASPYVIKLPYFTKWELKISFGVEMKQMIPHP